VKLYRTAVVLLALLPVTPALSQGISDNSFLVE